MIVISDPPLPELPYNSPYISFCRLTTRMLSGKKLRHLSVFSNSITIFLLKNSTNVCLVRFIWHH